MPDESAGGGKLRSIRVTGAPEGMSDDSGSGSAVTRRGCWTCRVRARAATRWCRRLDCHCRCPRSADLTTVHSLASVQIGSPFGATHRTIQTLFSSSIDVAEARRRGIEAVPENESGIAPGSPARPASATASVGERSVAVEDQGPGIHDLSRPRPAVFRSWASNGSITSSEPR
jgi:hypothetical protein